MVKEKCSSFFRKWVALFCLFFSQGLTSPRVYDCFTFFNELELLKIRFEELYDSVDYFILMEATQTFSAEPKPLYYLENKHDFKKYQDKIIHIVVDDLPMPAAGMPPEHWKRQEFQLNALLRGADQCANDDIILVSDLDEIPSKKAIDQIRNFFKKSGTAKDENQLVCELHMRLFLFHLNCESPYGWKGAVKAAPYWLMKKRLPWNIKLLHMYDRNLPKIYDAGWHFHSIFGNEERLVMKLRSIYRYDPLIDFAAATGFPTLGTLSTVEDWTNHADSFVQWSLAYFGSAIVPIDDSYPKYVQEHISHFRELGWLK